MWYLCPMCSNFRFKDTNDPSVRKLFSVLGLILKTSYLICLQGQSVAWHLLNKYIEYFLSDVWPVICWPFVQLWVNLSRSTWTSQWLAAYHWFLCYHLRFNSDTSELREAISMMPPSLIHPDVLRAVYSVCVWHELSPLPVAGAVTPVMSVTFTYSTTRKAKASGLSVPGPLGMFVRELKPKGLVNVCASVESN